MNYKEITDLIKLVNKSELSEFKLKKKDFELSIRTNSFNKRDAQVIHTATSSVPAPVNIAPPIALATSSATVQTPDVEDTTVGLLEVKSPIVGTFYRSASPDKPAFAKVGDSIAKGDTVCIVEAMKLFNEIESEVSGTIVKVLVEDAAPVEYDQVLFLVDPN